MVVDAEAGVEGWVEPELELELELDSLAEDVSAGFEFDIFICGR